MPYKKLRPCPVEDELAKALKDSLVWLILATGSANPRQGRNAMKQLRINIAALEKAGVDPGIKMEGLELISAEIDHRVAIEREYLRKAGRNGR